MKATRQLGAALVAGATACCAVGAGTHSPATAPIKLAVIGDSDSQSYQPFAAADNLRGGPWRPISLQWTELLAQWRGHEVHLGTWANWGSGSWGMQLARLMGGAVRAPAKTDFEYNFAISGQGCGGLRGDMVRQARQLAALIRADADAWADALVVVRIGAADLNDPHWLDAAAEDPHAPGVTARLARCEAAQTETVALLQAAQPRLRLVLVGALNEADDPAYWSRWRNATAQARIERALAPFDAHLQTLAAQDPARRLYFDNRAWFQQHWGGRDAQGEPAYRTLRLGPLTLKPHAGNAPDHALLGDHHFGTAANALWVQALLRALTGKWPDLGLTPITDRELHALWHTLKAAASARAVH